MKSRRRPTRAASVYNALLGLAVGLAVLVVLLMRGALGARALAHAHVVRSWLANAFFDAAATEQRPLSTKTTLLHVDAVVWDNAKLVNRSYQCWSHTATLRRGSVELTGRLPATMTRAVDAVCDDSASFCQKRLSAFATALQLEFRSPDQRIGPVHQLHAGDDDAVALWLARPAAATQVTVRLCAHRRVAPSSLRRGRAVLARHVVVGEHDQAPLLRPPPLLRKQPLAMRPRRADDGHWHVTVAWETTHSDGGEQQLVVCWPGGELLVPPQRWTVVHVTPRNHLHRAVLALPSYVHNATLRLRGFDPLHRHQHYLLDTVGNVAATLPLLLLSDSQYGAPVLRRILNTALFNNQFNNELNNQFNNQFNDLNNQFNDLNNQFNDLNNQFNDLNSQSGRYAGVLHLGDFVNNANRLDEWDRYFWSPFEQQRGGRLLPLWLVRGNHDGEGWRSYAYTGVAGGEGRFVSDADSWYVMEHGALRVVVLDSNLHPLLVPRQQRWLERTLRALDCDAAVGWIVVALHLPPYTELWEHPGVDGEPFVRGAWVPLFERHRVDLVLSGHTHAYLRGTRNGVRYAILGGAGGHLDTERYYDWQFFEVTASRHHYAQLLVTRDGVMRMDVFDADDQHTIDQLSWPSRSASVCNQ